MRPACFLLIPILYLLIGCNTNNNKARHIERDRSITPTTAYSDMFLDSMKLERFIAENASDEQISTRIRNFYNSRNFQFAWFTEEGLAEHAQSFWSLHHTTPHTIADSTAGSKKLHELMAIMTNEDSVIRPASDQMIQTEFLLTQHFFEYAGHAYDGNVDPVALQWHIPRKKLDVMALLDSLISSGGKNLETWEPVNNQYRLMRTALQRYNDIRESGGWQEIAPGPEKSLKVGDRSPAVLQVKQRLRLAGDFPLNDTTTMFTPELEQAVMQAQSRFGLKPDGVIGAALIRVLNVPVDDRIRQVILNMERMKWMPREPHRNRIVANIPEFRLHVYEDSTEVFDMNIVVGKAANRSVVFSDTLKYVVFSPYWNIPRSIVRNEILPGMKRSSAYLARRNMEQTGLSNGLPILRQKPGGSNALGKVKFIFPNSYNIYFHDTPAKSLFERENRALSHGCIRLSEPRKMAEYLLRKQSEWTPELIDEAMNASKEKWVTLKEPVPVSITYFTSWVGNDGLLNFRDDIYGHDEKLAGHLFAN